MKSFVIAVVFLLAGSIARGQDQPNRGPDSAYHAYSSPLDAAAAADPSVLEPYLHPAYVGELPAETQARVALEKFLDQLKAEGKLTAELELQTRSQIAAIASATAARMAKEAEERAKAAEKTVIVIDDRK